MSSPEREPSLALPGRARPRARPASFLVQVWPTSGHERDESGSRTDGNHHLSSRTCGDEPRSGAHDHLVEGGTQARDGVKVRAWRFCDGELEGLLALGRRPKNEGRRAAPGDRRVPPGADFLARRWATWGESGEGVYWGPVFIDGRRAGRTDRPGESSV